MFAHDDISVQGVVFILAVPVAEPKNFQVFQKGTSNWGAPLLGLCSPSRKLRVDHTHVQCPSDRGSQACGRGGKGVPSKLHKWPPAGSWWGAVLGGAPRSAERSADDRGQLSTNI
eukprot:1157027-Pelagomonas_calceolata.AAC.4